MRSPIVAMLWEQWRLTRTEASVRVVIGIGAASGVLLMPDPSAVKAFVLLVLVNAFPWFSLAKLNGGTALGGYNSGFPFRLLFTQPVRTMAIVGVAMGYDAVSCAIAYLVSASVVALAFGVSLPLVDVVPWLITFHLGLTCIVWSTRGRVLPSVGSLFLGLVLFVMLQSSVIFPLQVDFSPGKYQLMVLVCFGSIGLTAYGVARQRHGGAATRTRSAGYPQWLIGLFRIPCPTSSATKARLWFEMKRAGLPILLIGLAISMLMILLFALSIPLQTLRPHTLAISMIVFWSLPAALVIGGDAFGFRESRGRISISAFEATQPVNTARMAGLKIFVRSACVLMALAAVVLSIWISSGFILDAEAWGVSRKGVHMGMKLLEFRDTLRRGFLGGPTRAEYAVHAVLASILIVVLVAARAALTALRVRYPRWVLIGGMLLLGFIVAMTLAVRSGATGIFSGMDWGLAIVLAVATSYLAFDGVKEASLTVRYAVGAVVLAAAFGAACLPAPNVISLVVTVLLPLTILFLAPWALSRVRHS